MTTTLESILASLETPVHADITTHIIEYMRELPNHQGPLVDECATHLERSQTLGAVLAVVHALNGGEILLRHQDSLKEEDLSLTIGTPAAVNDDCDELSLEIERLLAADEKKPDAGSLTTKVEADNINDSTERRA